MNILCVVPCGKRKIWDKNKEAGPTPARDVYIGPFAKKCRDYAVKFFPDSYCILSAKYGFLFPSEIIPQQYNVSFNDRKTKPITISHLEEQAQQKNLFAYDKIVVLGGKSYIEMIEKIFPDKEILNPIPKSKGLGFMLKKINSILETGRPGVPID